MVRSIVRSKPAIIIATAILLWFSPAVYALGSQQNPQSGSLGLEATIPSSPPSTAATIAIPSSGQSFSSIPITISGLCPSNLLIKIIDNNVFVGSTVCSSGSYSLKVDLFNASNDLYAQDFDALGQGGPDSNSVSVTFNSGQYSTPGSQVTVTSSYAEQGVNPGQQLVWPIEISGGTPPYAISTTWGDGLSPTLQSSAYSGNINISHTFSTSGIYEVNETVTDNNGSTGFLSLVAVANGQLSATKSTNSTTPTSATSSTLPWWIFLLVGVAAVPAFWLGLRHGRSVISRKFE
ncbi:MAG: hypothetical protein ACREF7_02125 [Candidatus Saccharimonadales bacterium]